MTGEPKRNLFSVENFISAAYLALGLLLLALVFQSIRFRSETAYRKSDEFKKFGERAAELADLRKFATQGSTSIRDYLINNNPNAAQVYDDELRRSKASYVTARHKLDEWASQSYVLIQMDREATDFWKIVEENRPATTQEKLAGGYSLVHDDMLPARRELFKPVKLLEDRVAFDQDTLVRKYAKDRRDEMIGIFSTMGAIIFISLLLASGHQKFRRDFQKESRRKYQEMVLARDNLEQLSGRLLRIQEDERRKISRELHDGIGQLLTALRMEIHHVHSSLIGALPSGEDRLLRARKLAEEAALTVKDISLLLRPPLLDDLGLEPALTWLIEQFRRRTGIRCRFRAENIEELLPDTVKTSAFRIVQEALNNCEKHASPSEIEIVLHQSVDLLSICIEDDGAGFLLDSYNAPAQQAGLGILGMRERAVLLGGTLHIESAPGLGTKLQFCLPIVKVASEREILALPAPRRA